MSDPTQDGHFLLVGGGGSVPTGVRRARQGARISVLCDTGSVAQFASYADVRHLIALADADHVASWVQWASFLDRQDPVTWLGSARDQSMPHLSAIGAQLGLPVPGPETVRAVSDKIEMRRRLCDAGLATIDARRAASHQEVADFAAAHSYPLICKPVAGTASQGVSRIGSAADIAAALAWGKGYDLMVEPFVSGQEFSVECLSEDGTHLPVCVTATYSDPVHFVELGHALPAPVSPATQERVEVATCQALDALGVRDGVTHTEVVASAETVQIIETHIRPAGGEIPILVRHALGVDLYDLAIRRWLREPVLGAARRARNDHAARDCCTAIWYVWSMTPGKIAAIKGADAAAAMPGVREVDITVAPGAEYGGLRSSDTRAGHVWAEGSSIEEAVEKARVAAQSISLIFE